MSYFPELNGIFIEPVEQGFSGSFKQPQKSILWIGEAEETPIAGVMIQDRGDRAILKVYIAEIHRVKLNLEVTAETVFIQGEPTESSIVPGYFRPSGFESLIPLPYPVEPETCEAEVHSDGLTIKFTKQLESWRQRVRIENLTVNSSPPEILIKSQDNGRKRNF